MGTRRRMKVESLVNQASRTHITIQREKQSIDADYETARQQTHECHTYMMKRDLPAIIGTEYDGSFVSASRRLLNCSM